MGKRLTRQERIEELGRLMKEAIEESIESLDIPDELKPEVVQNIRNLDGSRLGTDALRVWEAILTDARDFENWEEFVSETFPTAKVFVGRDGSIQYLGIDTMQPPRPNKWDHIGLVEATLPYPPSDWPRKAFPILWHDRDAELCRECGINVCLQKKDVCRLCGHDEAEKKTEIQKVLSRAAKEYDRAGLDASAKEDFLSVVEKAVEQAWYKDFRDYQAYAARGQWPPAVFIIVLHEDDRVQEIKTKKGSSRPNIPGAFIYRIPLPRELFAQLQKVQLRGDWG